MAVLALATAAAAPAKNRPRNAGASSACAGASNAAQDARHLTRTMLCLHDRRRSGRGLGGLHWSSVLAGAAQSHAADMVRRHYFEHRSPEGGDAINRLKSVGYGRRAVCWGAGENLLVTDGPTTPRQLIDAWMQSVTHRHIILGRRWREFGLGVVMATPSGQPGGMTVVALFGRRYNRPCRHLQGL